MKKTRVQTSSKTRADREIIEQLAALLKAHDDVRIAYLFGSRARGTQRQASDVDVAVAFAEGTSAWGEVELQEQLAHQLGVPVQVVDLARAGPRIVKAVRREGIRLVGHVQLVEEPETVGEEGTERSVPDPRADEAVWLLESAADKVQRIARALPLLTDVELEAVLAGEMTAVRDLLGVFMLLIEPLETLVRRVSRYAHVVLGYAEPEATLRAQTVLAAQVMSIADDVVEGLGAVARLRGQLAHTLEDRDRLIRIEAALKEFKEAVAQRIDSVDKRIDSVDKRVDSVDKRVERLETVMMGGFGLLFTSMIGLVGFVLWDRRSALAPAIRTTRELAEREERLESALRERGR
jgi:predicted nucleotidyltransferase